MKKRASLFASVFALILLASFAANAPHFVHSQTAENVWVNDVIPGQIGRNDVARYQAAWAAQQKKNWAEADEALSAVSNPILKGDVLAERYLHRHYTASKQELTTWLAHYSETPKASAIVQLLANIAPEEAQKFAHVEKPAMMNVMGDDNGLAASFDESKHAGVWQAAMSAYQRGDKAKAAQYFEAMISDKETLSPWKVSAAGYWAWRSYKAIGENEKATQALRVAASEPRSFYGILARKKLGQSLAIDESGLSLTTQELNTLQQSPHVARAIAFTQTERKDLAEIELRIAYMEAEKQGRRSLLNLAHALNLPAVQIAMAKRLETSTESLDAAKYPVPDWSPVGGFNVDPALIFALIRQESGFRTSAVSPAGAMGLMQLMPSTANMVKNRMNNEEVAAANEAERNISMGQYYVSHLLKNPIVDNNVIYMLASYNAGIGRVQEWKSSLHYNDDPLLFIENIPFDETRYYVMQVMTNYWLYSEMLGQETPSLADLAMGEWPTYRG